MPLSTPVRAALLALALGGAACSSPPATASAAPQATVSGARLVFFLNPAGAPCQLQDEVIRGMSQELTGKVSVVYLRTSEPSELPYFQRFGVRALPQLVVVDAAGAEVRRATPGVQDAAAIRRLVGI